jgi:hypothetical protein
MLDSNTREVQILASAFHEAGHTVSAINSGLHVRYLFVSFDSPGDGFIAQNQPNHFNPIYPGISNKSVETAWNIALENIKKRNVGLFIRSASRIRIPWG